MTAGRTGPWSRSYDRFIGVRFPEAGTRDILWESLEIIDKEEANRVSSSVAEHSG